MTTTAFAVPPESPRVDLMGLSFHAVTEAEVVEHVGEALSRGQGGWIVTPNLDILRRARRDDAFHGLIHDADLTVADGMPLIWASRLQGTPLPERVAGSSLVSTLADRLAQDGRSLFLLGGSPGTARAAGDILAGRNPNLNVVGSHCPPMGFEQDPEETKRIESALLGARPDVVYVGLGSPKQEQLIKKLKPLLPQTWWIGVGVSFSFLCGDIKRAPIWAQHSGLEWAHRLIQEPGRLWKRYLVNGLPFGVRLMAASLRTRLARVEGR